MPTVGAWARADAARVEHESGNENASIPSRKNGRFSGKKVSKLVRLQDHLVGFDLGEVGVERGVQRQVVREMPLEIQARPIRRD